MDNFTHLEFTRIMPRRNGIFAFTRFPGWKYEYEFLLQEDGKVLGKTHEGTWAELTEEFAEFIKAKVKEILIERSSLVYV